MTREQDKPPIKILGNNANFLNIPYSKLGPWVFVCLLVVAGFMWPALSHFWLSPVGIGVAAFEIIGLLGSFGYLKYIIFVEKETFPSTRKLVFIGLLLVAIMVLATAVLAEIMGAQTVISWMTGVYEPIFAGALAAIVLITIIAPLIYQAVWNSVPSSTEQDKNRKDSAYSQCAGDVVDGVCHGENLQDRLLSTEERAATGTQESSCSDEEKISRIQGKSISAFRSTKSDEDCVLFSVDLTSVDSTDVGRFLEISKKVKKMYEALCQAITGTGEATQINTAQLKDLFTNFEDLCKENNDLLLSEELHEQEDATTTTADRVFAWIGKFNSQKNQDWLEPEYEYQEYLRKEPQNWEIALSLVEKYSRITREKYFMLETEEKAQKAETEAQIIDKSLVLMKKFSIALKQRVLATVEAIDKKIIEKNSALEAVLALISNDSDESTLNQIKTLINELEQLNQQRQCLPLSLRPSDQKESALPVSVAKSLSAWINDVPSMIVSVRNLSLIQKVSNIEAKSNLVLGSKIKDLNSVSANRQELFTIKQAIVSQLELFGLPQTNDAKDSAPAADAKAQGKAIFENTERQWLEKLLSKVVSIEQALSFRVTVEEYVRDMQLNSKSVPDDFPVRLEAYLGDSKEKVGGGGEHLLTWTEDQIIDWIKDNLFKSLPDNIDKTEKAKSVFPYLHQKALLKGPLGTNFSRFSIEQTGGLVLSSNEERIDRVFDRFIPTSEGFEVHGRYNMVNVLYAFSNGKTTIPISDPKGVQVAAKSRIQVNVLSNPIKITVVSAHVDINNNLQQFFKSQRPELDQARIAALIAKEDERRDAKTSAQTPLQVRTQQALTQEEQAEMERRVKLGSYAAGSSSPITHVSGTPTTSESSSASLSGSPLSSSSGARLSGNNLDLPNEVTSVLEKRGLFSNTPLPAACSSSSSSRNSIGVR